MAEAKTIGFNFNPAEDYKGDWQRYFTEYNSQLAAFKEGDTPEGDEAPAPATTVVVEPGHLISGDELPGNARGPVGIYRKLEAAGWILRAQKSQTFEKGKVYGPNAQKAGESARDKHLEHWWIAGRRGDSQFMAYWMRDEGALGFQDCLTNDAIFTKVKDMNEWLLERSLDNDIGTEESR